jgi:exonuclease-1
MARAKSLTAQGRHKEARDHYTKCVDITPEMALQLIKVSRRDRSRLSIWTSNLLLSLLQALKAEQVPYVVAPYEADAQLAYLEKEGIVDGIITEDSDLLVFGCKNVRSAVRGRHMRV